MLKIPKNPFLEQSSYKVKLFDIFQNLVFILTPLFYTQKSCRFEQYIHTIFQQKKGGRAPGAYKARFAAWLSFDSYSEDI